MKIFISYSWKNKDIADIIDNDWRAIGIPLIRDERDLVFKKNIKEFMKNVSKVDFVLLLISKGYLESKNCMYEALEMVKDDNFLERVLPIVLDDAHVSDTHKCLTYIKFWENEIEKLNEAIKSIKIIGKLKSIQEDLDHLIDIRNSIDTFLSALLNIRYLTWQEAKQSNYKQLFEEIGFSDSNIYKEAVRIWNISEHEDQELALEKFSINYPSNKFSIYLRASIADKHDKKKKAKQYYEELLDKFPDEYPAHIVLAYLLETYFKNYTKAKYHYERGIELMPDDYNAHFRLALLVEDHFKDYENVRYHYEETIRINPNYVKAHNNLGLLLTDFFSEHKLAKYQFEQVLQIDPNNAFAHYNLANLLKEYFNEYVEAKYHYEEAIKSDPNYAEAYNNLGTLLRVNFHDYEQAISCHERALHINPNLFQAHANLSIIYEHHLNDIEKAKYHYSKVLEINRVNINKDRA